MTLTFSLSSFFFNDTATTEIYTLSLHDALPICCQHPGWRGIRSVLAPGRPQGRPQQVLRGLRRGSPGSHGPEGQDRKSTRLNSSHGYISYAVFCLKKKNKNRQIQTKNQQTQVRR